MISKAVQGREGVWTVWHGLVPIHIYIRIMIPLLSTNLTNFDISKLGGCMEGKIVWRAVVGEGDGIRVKSLRPIAGSP